MSSRRADLTAAFTPLTRLGREENGSAAMILGVSLAMVVGFAALAVDLSWIQFTRSRLQTSADAAALAGAGALVSNGNDLALVGDTALDYGRRNLIADDAPALAVTAEDVLFLSEGAPTAANPDQVEVSAHRAADRGNPLKLFFGGVIGTPTADVAATARAGLVGACSSKCLKPFTVPAKFTWNDDCDANASYGGNGKLDTGSTCEVASVQVQGYSDVNVGEQIVLKPGDPHDTIVPSFYNLINFPPVNKGSPVTGADEIRDNIAGCTASNTTVVDPEDELQMEPGNETGPVKQGISDLVSEDPGAYWDTATNSVKGSAFADPLDSPRVALLAFYDPRRPPVSGRNSLFVQQLGAVFIEGIDGKGNVTARFMRARAESPSSTGGECLLKVVRMLRDSGRGG